MPTVCDHFTPGVTWCNRTLEPRRTAPINCYHVWVFPWGLPHYSIDRYDVLLWVNKCNVAHEDWWISGATRVSTKLAQDPEIRRQCACVLSVTIKGVTPIFANVPNVSQSEGHDSFLCQQPCFCYNWMSKNKQKTNMALLVRNESLESAWVKASCVVVRRKL